MSRPHLCLRLPRCSLLLTPPQPYLLTTPLSLCVAVAVPVCGAWCASFSLQNLYSSVHTMPCLLLSLFHLLRVNHPLLTIRALSDLILSSPPISWSPTSPTITNTVRSDSSPLGSSAIPHTLPTPFLREESDSFFLKSFVLWIPAALQHASAIHSIISPSPHSTRNTHFFIVPYSRIWKAKQSEVYHPCWLDQGREGTRRVELSAPLYIRSGKNIANARRRRYWGICPMQDTLCLLMRGYIMRMGHGVRVEDGQVAIMSWLDLFFIFPSSTPYLGDLFFLKYSKENQRVSAKELIFFWDTVLEVGNTDLVRQCIG